MNPIISMLNNRNSMNSIISMLKGNPNAAYQQMLQSNPQFAEFVNKNKDKTPDQIMRQYGVDPNQVSNILQMLK